MYVCMYVCIMYVCMYVKVSMYVCVHVRMYNVCMPFDQDNLFSLGSSPDVSFHCCIWSTHMAYGRCIATINRWVPPRLCQNNFLWVNRSTSLSSLCYLNHGLIELQLWICPHVAKSSIWSHNDIVLVSEVFSI